MSESTQSLSTSFQQANSLLRNKKWENALSAYQNLWKQSPHLQRLLLWNINYLLRKAPPGALEANSLKATTSLLQEANERSLLGCQQKQVHSEQVNPAVALDRYLKQKIAEKKLPKSPHEESVLLWANGMANEIGYEAAYLYAERYLPERLQYSLHALQANASLSRGDEAAWLYHLNQYLQKFGSQPLVIKDGNSILSRLSTKLVKTVEEGPLVTVIMPAWNAEDTVAAAADSILNQTWRPIELIIIDDASTDKTFQVLQRLAKADSRVKVLRNRVNVGPYVSKNIALSVASGEYVTGHDADDWALPQRVENHIKEVLTSNRVLKASLSYMVRLNPAGEFSHIGKIGGFSFDGVARKASISCMFEMKTLKERLGYWDSVRFGADSEMISRAEKSLGTGFCVLQQIGMICLDLETSLTNHPIHGVRTQGGGMAESRLEFRASWSEWHKEISQDSRPYLPFPQQTRCFKAPQEMLVPYEHQLENFSKNIENFNI